MSHTQDSENRKITIDVGNGKDDESEIIRSLANLLKKEPQSESYLTKKIIDNLLYIIVTGVIALISFYVYVNVEITKTHSKIERLEFEMERLNRITNAQFVTMEAKFTELDRRYFQLRYSGPRNQNGGAQPNE